MSTRSVKSNGIHYTPVRLATFLAEQAFQHFEDTGGRIRVLDPACGDGALLQATYQQCSMSQQRRLELWGFETDPAAAERATARLSGLESCAVSIVREDFLSQCGAIRESEETLQGLFEHDAERIEPFDMVVANPPYVRTQVLGARRAQQLARTFGLRGRVDLYHAFVTGIQRVLRVGGVLALLTSNRFALVQSGASLRALLRNSFDLKAVYDLGDTKLFSAAVLPLVLVAVRRGVGRRRRAEPCRFVRAYEARPDRVCNIMARYDSVLDAIRGGVHGVVHTEKGRFEVVHGTLAEGNDDQSWSLSSPDRDEWIARVHAHRARCFADVGAIRVGIKTTADSVFLRDDWDSLPAEWRPEAALLRPLITHATEARWLLSDAAGVATRVLYPHIEDSSGRRRVVELDDYPAARAYLERHRKRLESRRYVIEAGRRWYEIWVPQQPAAWPLPKVVFPDIAERPRFFLDSTGSVVNGDCYWLRPNARERVESLYLLLAVANSTFITRYYDVRFHNKLYSGRRRFITQYVAQFPLPPLDAPISREIAESVRLVMNASRDREAIERHIDDLVWRSFGFDEEIGR